jgi:hypothetical protein
MRRFAAACVLSALSFLFLVSFVHRPAGVRAGTTVRLDMAGLVQRSALILEGRVLSSKPVETGGRIETEHLLFVERTFEGDDQSLRVIRLPGGMRADGSGMVLAGMPRLQDGENVLLFLSEAGETGIRVPVGLAQGKYSVLYTETGEKLLSRSMSGLSLVNEDTGGPVPGTGREVRTYASVVAEIEAALVAKRAAAAARKAGERSSEEVR